MGFEAYASDQKNTQAYQESVPINVAKSHAKQVSELTS